VLQKVRVIKYILCLSHQLEPEVDMDADEEIEIGTDFEEVRDTF
jgi:hypothetical protein